MEEFSRYAVYYAPEPGAFADRAASWLGWDPVAAREPAHPDLGLPAAAMTDEPRRYGFHGTLKPPFRLAPGFSRADLEVGIADLAAGLKPVRMPGLELADLDGFLALRPLGDPAALDALAASCVTGLDRFRAPLTAQETARRRPERLTGRQRDYLDRWGYPWVLEEFRFHLTLTGRLEPQAAAAARPVLAAHFADVLPSPFRIAELCLFGQRQDGRFALLHRYALAG